MDTKKINAITESIKSVNEKIKEIPKENFNIIFEEEIKNANKKTDVKKNQTSKISDMKSFIQGIAMRNIIFENENEKIQEK
ncbi:MAG: hypothetical protein ACO2PO_09510 [Candidatus Calescibacterium sp.]|jgi:hypothetical protein